MENLNFTINGKRVMINDPTPSINNWNKEEWKVIEFLKTWLNKNEFIQQQTSGSTGEPKLVSIQKSVMQKSAAITLDYFDLKPNSTFLLCLPIDYIAGKMMVVRAILAEANLVIVKPELNPLLNFKNTEIDFAAFTPLMLTQILENPESNKNLQKVKLAIIGGAPSSGILISQLKNQTGQFYETYGMTETVSHIALKKIHPNKEEYFTCLSDYSVSLGAFKNLKVNVKSLLGKEIETNDIAEIQHSKSFKILGRNDFIINSGGVKILPELIENEWTTLLNQPCLVSSIESAKYGEALVLITKQNIENQVFLNTSKQLSNKVYNPKFRLQLKDFPMLTSGKIDRKTLKEWVKCQFTGRAET